MATIRDLVLVHVDNRPGFFARIEEIVPDVKPGWWQVRLLVLTLPLQVYTWILDESQINGAPFTMGGTPMVLENVVCPPQANERRQPFPTSSNEEEPTPSPSASDAPSPAKVVFLADRKKKD